MYCINNKIFAQNGTAFYLVSRNGVRVAIYEAANVAAAIEAAKAEEAPYGGEYTAQFLGYRVEGAERNEYGDYNGQ